MRNLWALESIGAERRRFAEPLAKTRYNAYQEFCQYENIAVSFRYHYYYRRAVRHDVTNLCVFRADRALQDLVYALVPGLFNG